MTKRTVIKKAKSLTVAFLIIALLLSNFAFLPNRAQAAIAGVSAGRNFANFPSWYIDSAGLKLESCLGTNLDGSGPADPNCVVLADEYYDGINPISFPTNFPGEFFYYIADADAINVGPTLADTARFRMALEGTFVTGAPEAGSQITFIRVRLQQLNNLTASSTYTVSYPFGTFTFDTDATGVAISNAGGGATFLAEDGPGAGGDFTILLPATATNVSKFLAAVNPAAPAGYLGNPGTLQTIEAGTNGAIFAIDGPDIGGVGVDHIETALWNVAGKIAIPVLNSITITPVAPSVAANSTQQFTISAFDQFSDPIVPADVIIWTSSNPAVGTIDSGSGLFTAIDVGTTVITATSGSVSGTTTATVVSADPVLSSIIIAPANYSMVYGNTQQFTGIALDQYGNQLVSQPIISWSSSNTAVGTVDNAGLFSALAVGNTIITAASDLITATTSVSVTAPVAEPLHISQNADGTVKVDASSGFPIWFGDSAGLRVQQCLAGLDGTADPNCIVVNDLGATLTGQISFPDNFPSEMFYYIADTDPLSVGSALAGRAKFRIALEGAFTGGSPAAGQQLTFLRINLQQINGLEPNSAYTVTYPFGTFVFHTDGNGTTLSEGNAGGGGTAFRNEDGPGGAGTFTILLPATATNISKFLAAVNPAAPAGYLGNLGTLQTIEAGTNGAIFKIDGPNIGGEGINTISTDQWTVAGKISANTAPAITPISDQTATIGTLFNFTVTANDAEADPITYSIAPVTAIGNEATAIINPTTGVISWTPTTSGTSVFTVSASDGSLTTTANLNINVVAAPPVVAQPAVNLGTAGNFIILAKSGISNTGATSITGNIGVSPIDSTAVTGFGLTLDATNQFSKSALVSGNIYASDYAFPTPADMTAAISDMETAFNDAAGRTLPDFTELGAGNIGGLTLAPGLYKWSSGVTIPTNVTLSGGPTDVWIFQIAGTLDISPATQVILTGGALPENIFWQVADQTTLGTTSVFNGNILDQTAIVLNTGATLNGRALAQTAVTLDANTISMSVVAPIVDTIAPVIVMNGFNSVNVTQNTIYTDAGATATDNIDPVVTVIATGVVDPAVVGVYTITYSVSDAAGNAATPVTRTVNVVAAPLPDTTAPVIIMNGATPVEVIQSTVYTDAGATATDNVDQAVTVLTTGTVDTAVVGAYTLTYTALDAAGNAATPVTRTVNVVAAPPVVVTVVVTTAAPAITVGATQPLSAAVIDPVGTAVTPAPVIIFTSTVPAVATVDAAGVITAVATGTTTISAIADGAVTGETLITVVEPTPEPILTTVSIATAAPTIASGTQQQLSVAAIDQTGTAIVTPPAPIILTSADPTVATVDQTTGIITAVAPGTTIITADCGGTVATIDVTVIAAPPVVSQVDRVQVNPDLINLHLGDIQQFTAQARDINNNVLDPQPIITWSMKNNDITVGNVDVNGLFTATALGTTTVVATMDNIAGEVDVVVSEMPPADIIAPVITILGNNPESIIQNNVYTDVGATALDAVDGAVSVIVSGTVNVAVIGEYTITYSAVDAAGNAATITRAVNVAAAPVIPVLTTINLTPSQFNLTTGSTQQLTAIALDQNNNPISAVISWSSNNANARVNNSGRVTAVAPGSTIIMATSGEISATAAFEISSSTKLELISDDNLAQELENQGAFIPDSDNDFTSTTELTATRDILLKIRSSAGDSEVDLPLGVKISDLEGGRIDSRQLIANAASLNLLSGLNADLTAKGAIRWGIDNKHLQFSLPITLKIFVGNELNGQTLNIRRSIDGASGWTSDGIVEPAASLVTNGMVTFQATKASFYVAAAQAAVSAPSSIAAKNDGGGHKKKKKKKPAIKVTAPKKITVNRGAVISFGAKAKGNKKPIVSYSYTFRGITRKLKNPVFAIPRNIRPGKYAVTVRAINKMGKVKAKTIKLTVR